MAKRCPSFYGQLYKIAVYFYQNKLSYKVRCSPACYSNSTWGHSKHARSGAYRNVSLGLVETSLRPHRRFLQNEGRESPRFQPWDDRPTIKIFLEQNPRQGISLREQWEELAHYFLRSECVQTANKTLFGLFSH